MWRQTQTCTLCDSSICPGDQSPDRQLGHKDVPACVLEPVLWRHGGVLRALLQTPAGGHTSRRHLRATWYGTAHTAHSLNDDTNGFLESCGNLIGILLTHFATSVRLLFSEQDKSEGDALHRERSGAQRSVWAVGDCYQHHRHQSSQWEGPLHDW